MELWFDVAMRLIRECAVVTSRLVESRLTPNSPYWVELSRDIYVTLITMDGISYVQGLSNTRDTTTAHLAWRAKASSVPVEVYVAEDHFGIRGLLLDWIQERGRPATRDAVGGVWWTRLSTSSSGKLQVYSDVSFPRNVYRRMRRLTVFLGL